MTTGFRHLKAPMNDPDKEPIIIDLSWPGHAMMFHCRGDSVIQSNGCERHLVGMIVIEIKADGGIIEFPARGCECCGNVDPGVLPEDSGRMNAPEPLLLCRPCADEHIAYWIEQWREWNWSRG